MINTEAEASEFCYILPLFCYMLMPGIAEWSGVLFPNLRVRSPLGLA